MRVESIESPIVKIKLLLLETIKVIIRSTDLEIALKLFITKKDNEYEIINYFMPKQQVTAMTCKIIAEEEMKQIFEQDIDTDNMLGMFHSHVDMNASPSHNDDKSFEDQYKQVDEFYLELIMNKRGEHYLRLADLKKGLIFSNMELHIINDIPGLITTEEAMKQIKENTIEKLEVQDYNRAKKIYETFGSKKNKHKKEDDVIFDNNDDWVYTEELGWISKEEYKCMYNEEEFNLNGELWK